MGNDYFKKMYRTGLSIFLIFCTISFLSIYGVLKMTIEPITVKVTDTVYVDKEVIKVVKDTVLVYPKPVIIPQPKPIKIQPEIPKKDTISE